MRTCSNWGARVAGQLEWCNQCYDASPAVRSAVTAATEPPLWIRSNVGRPARVEIAPELSRWRGGAASFEPVGRSLLTLGLMLLLVVGYPVLRGLVFTVLRVDVPGGGFVLMYICVTLPSGAYLLRRDWKRERVA